ncbi:MAG: long-chain fatty acid--CoA ligase [bacterium]
MAPAATIAELFWNAVRDHGDRPAQEWFDGTAWQSRSYLEFGRAVRDLANALAAAGLRKGDRVAIWSKSSPQWAAADMACQSAGFVTVPIYDTLTGDKGGYILKDSQTRLLFVQDAALLARLSTVRVGLRDLERVVLLSGSDPSAQGMSQFLAAGRSWAETHREALDEAVAGIDADDLASIVYTSGTTGEPKGVVLTHGNFASNAHEIMGCVKFGPSDTFLSFLPLSHVYERAAGHFAAYAAGAKVCFARSVDTLMDDMQHARPTIMTSVPRLYEKMHARIRDTIGKESWLKRRIFAWAIATGRKAIPYRIEDKPVPGGLGRRLRIADKLVFAKLRARLGGRLRYFVSGGAALSRDIESFFWAAGIQILQGYGLTETSPVTNVNRPGGIRLGSVGRTIPHVEIRIDTRAWEPTRPHETDRPAEGEICFRGPNVMQGYWRNEEATKAVFDADGWFHTGDIGYVDADGYLFITDRKKEIIVMSNGKKVAPQAIENALQLQPHIAQACILGEQRNYIAALVVPNWQALETFALAAGIAAKDRERLAADPRVVSLVEAEVEAVNATLSRYEQVKKFWIVPVEWSVESGELTPSLKLKRRIIQDKFKLLVERLYPEAGHGLPSDGHKTNRQT